MKMADTLHNPLPTPVPIMLEEMIDQPSIITEASLATQDQPTPSKQAERWRKRSNDHSSVTTNGNNKLGWDKNLIDEEDLNKRS